MRPFKRLKRKQKARTFKKLRAPARKRFPAIAPLESSGDRPLQMTFKEQLNALLQALEQNVFAKQCVALPKGIKKFVEKREKCFVLTADLWSFS